MSSQQKTLTPSQDLFAGAVAGMSSRVLIAPLDVLKIRFQIQQQTRGLYHYTSMCDAVRCIVAREGVRALWKGNISALLMVTPYASLQLAAFYQLRRVSPLTREPYSSLVLGAAAGSFATVCTYPLDLLRTRFAAQAEPLQYRSIPHAIRTIYARDGVSGFYSGLRPTLIEIIPYVALHFAFYEAAKVALLEGRSDPVPLQTLTAGALSGTASKFLTLPLDTAKKVLQVDRQFSNHSEYRGITHVLTSLWHRDGLRGWFRGTTPSLIKAAPNSAITFAVYEKVKSALAVTA